MTDKRVVRGSTHAAMVIPAGTYNDTIFKSGQKPNKSRGGATNQGLGYVSLFWSH